MTEPGRPRAIVTNDDGIDGEGLSHLAVAAAGAGLDVLVAAPAGEASGSGTAMTAVRQEGRVEIERRELPGPAAGIAAYAVKATPAFIAFVAARGAFGFTPDVVLSGINHGPNTGRVVLHSGTAGAALAAAAQGIPAAAFSLDTRGAAGPLEWPTATLIAGQVIKVLQDVSAGVMLNVNIPNVPPGRLAGIRRARLASLGAVQVSVAERSEGYLQLKMGSPADEPEPGSDSALLSAGYASVTPVYGICEAPADGLPWPAAEPADARQPG